MDGKKIQKLLRNPIKELKPPLFYFKWTQEAAQHNINILDASNRYLGEAIKSQWGIPLYYCS